jgi:hypothetical protein
MTNFGFTEILIVLLGIILVIAAVIDVRTFTISNWLNLCVALLAPVYWWSVSLPLWPDAPVQLAAAAIVFVILAGAFHFGMMGGGDVKLAAALALWFSPPEISGHDVDRRRRSDSRHPGRSSPALERGPAEDSVWRCNRLRGLRHSHPTVS